ncbi:uncharacterized protein [Antedon mediterranea]|uniref:uncharacterized protein n=1 Tax=Antedon mediterranea TaxID=105859 RepID=UPI003AF5F4D5
MEEEMEDSKLHEAVRYGDTNVVIEALADGFDPNAIGFLQWTPVQEAACNGDLEILQILLQNKGNANAKDKLLGSTAVHYAAKEGNVECLQALLDHGGLYDLQDNNGHTSLDVAVGKCYDLLDNWRIKDLAESNIKTRFATAENKQNVEENIPEKNDESVKKLPKAWEKELPEENSLIHSSGHLQLSFEYNSKSKMFKIRVWMLQDLLLPPVEASTVNRICIRSQLLPDKKGDSKRRTEEHLLGDKMWNQTLLTLKRKGHKESFKATFLPCTFKFSKALEYQNITKEIVENRVVHLDVCAKQKYGRSFVIASIQITLKEAVKKLIKEKFPLHPCINICMPDNVHAYDPKDLLVCPEGMYRNLTTSNPNMRTKSKQSLLVETDTRRATSDNDLKAVRCHSTDSIPSIVVNIPEPTENISEILEEIRTMDTGPKTTFLSKSNPEFTTIEMQEINLPHSTGDELLHVKVLPGSHSSPNITIVDMEEEDDNFRTGGEELKTKSNNSKFGSHKPGYVVDIRDNAPNSFMFQKKTNKTILKERKTKEKSWTKSNIEQVQDTPQDVVIDLPENQSKTKKGEIKVAKTRLRRAKQERTRIGPSKSFIPQVMALDETITIATQSSHVPINRYTFTRPVTNDLVQTELGYNETIELNEFKHKDTIRPNSNKLVKGRSNNPEKSLESGSILPSIHVGRSENILTQLHIESEQTAEADSERVKKMLANTNFKKTKDVVRPASRYTNDIEEHELVLIPGTPLASPISDISSHNQQKYSSGNSTGKEKQLQNKSVEKHTINRQQQSWF